MSVVDSFNRRPRVIVLGAPVLAAVFLVVPGGGAAAARQRSKAAAVTEHPALRNERLARELEERRERQLRAGLAEAAA